MKWKIENLQSEKVKNKNTTRYSQFSVKKKR